MSTKYIFLVLLFISFSCADQSKINEVNFTKNEESNFNFWLKEYKNVTFQRCLYLGFNKSSEIKAFLELDYSTHQDFAFGLPQYQYIDSIVQPVILQAKKDSIKFHEEYLKARPEIELDNMNGLPMMKYCLEFYTSEELKNIAKDKVLEMDFLWKDY